MNDANRRLAQALKLGFGTAPNEPTDAQLQSIKTHITAIRSRGLVPSDADWEVAVRLYCPGAGKYKYAGIDNSDLNTLLELAQKSQ